MFLSFCFVLPQYFRLSGKVPMCSTTAVVFGKYSKHGGIISSYVILLWNCHGPVGDASRIRYNLLTLKHHFVITELTEHSPFPC